MQFSAVYFISGKMEGGSNLEGLGTLQECTTYPCFHCVTEIKKTKSKKKYSFTQVDLFRSLIL